jgi:hypothetical protein
MLTHWAFKISLPGLIPSHLIVVQFPDYSLDPYHKDPVGHCGSESWNTRIGINFRIILAQSLNKWGLDLEI